MSNLPTMARQSTATLPPAPRTREDDTRLAVLLSRLERAPDGRWHLPDTQPVSADDRRWLQARRTTLERSLVRAARMSIGRLVIGMFEMFPSAASCTNPSERDELFVAGLSAFPQWAIEAAISRLKGSFAPSLPVLQDMVCGELAAVHAEISSVSRILGADTYHVPDEAERSRVEAAYRDLLEKLEWNAPHDLRPAKDRSLTRQEAIQAAEDMRSEPVTLPPLSDRLRARLGLGEAAE